MMSGEERQREGGLNQIVLPGHVQDRCNDEWGDENLDQIIQWVVDKLTLGVFWSLSFTWREEEPLTRALANAERSLAKIQCKTIWLLVLLSQFVIVKSALLGIRACTACTLEVIYPSIIMSPKWALSCKTETTLKVLVDIGNCREPLFLQRRPQYSWPLLIARCKKKTKAALACLWPLAFWGSSFTRLPWLNASLKNYRHERFLADMGSFKISHIGMEYPSIFGLTIQRNWFIWNML